LFSACEALESFLLNVAACRSARQEERAGQTPDGKARRVDFEALQGQSA
jgi:hypothetical protein